MSAGTQYHGLPGLRQRVRLEGEPLCGHGGHGQQLLPITEEWF